MAPVSGGADADDWPDRVTLRTQDGREIPARIAWIERDREAVGRGWTDPRPGWNVRAIDETDAAGGSSRRQSSGRAVLLASLPDDGTGPLHLGDQVIEPRWFDPPRPIADRGDSPNSAVQPRAAIKPERRPDRPAPDNPFTYWRWTLLADDMAFTPFEPSVYGRLGERVARYQADLWRLALNRLADIDIELARRCRSLLTQRCKDPTLPTGVATWISEPSALSGLLTRLLDFNVSNNRVANAARQWIEAHAGVIVWPISDEGDRVWVALANPSVESVTAQWRWSDAPAVRNETAREDNSIEQIKLSPLKVNRIAVDRPDAPQDFNEQNTPTPAIREARYQLQINAPHRQLMLPYGPRTSPARPPGAFFQPFASTLTLADVRAKQIRRPSEDRQTIMHVRKSGSRWEVFVECRRPSEAYEKTLSSASPSTQKADTTSINADGLHETTTSTQSWYGRWYDELRGREAIAVLLGTRSPQSQSPAVSLIVPEHGKWRVRDSDAPAGLEVHRRSYKERWLVRIVLPNAWLDGRYGASTPTAADQSQDAKAIGEADSLLIGALRTHGDSDAIESTPGAALPWQADAVRRLISLRHWDE